MKAWKSPNESLKRPLGQFRVLTNDKAILKRTVLKANDPAEIFGKMKDKAYLDLAARKYALGEDLMLK
jgi:hypothetical protein